MNQAKKNILVAAIKIKIERGEGTLEEILSTYSKLTDAEKGEIRNELLN